MRVSTFTILRTCKTNYNSKHFQTLSNYSNEHKVNTKYFIKILRRCCMYLTKNDFTERNIKLKFS